MFFSDHQAILYQISCFSYQTYILLVFKTTYCYVEVDCTDSFPSVSIPCTILAFRFRGRIFSRVQPFYEQAVSNLDRPMHRSLWV